MATFLVLARDSFDWGSLQPEELQQVYGGYVAYDEKVKLTGKLLGGAKLDEDGRVLRSGAHGDVEVTGGPYRESKDVLGGYMVLEAGDYDEAVEVTRTHPHLRFGNIEIRRLDEESGM